MACWLWLAWRGGGYTINEWGMWAIVSAAAIAVILIAIGPPLLGWLPWVSPGALVGLTLLAWLSILWAAWPQNALVEGDRSLFYACVLVVCLLALGRVDGRRVAAGLVVAGAGTIAVIEAWALVADGRRLGLLVRPPGRRHRLRRRHGGAGGGRGVAGRGVRRRPRNLDRAARHAPGSPPAQRPALVIPTGSRAALVALVASGLVFAALCPTPRALRCDRAAGARSSSHSAGTI